MRTWTIATEAPDSPAATALWRAYYTEVSDRWFAREYGPGHSTPADDLERGIASETGSDLAPPTGTLLVGRCAGVAAGTVGLRLLDATRAELTRVYVRKEARGTGGARLLLEAAEDTARGLGVRRLVLDTRLDLVEARALYARHGYAEVPAHNRGPYAEVWYAKDLETTGTRAYA
ncbi:GNAT family N-acetyltransferase [Streptomyces triticagri]|uniref:GNAT family N-acetyltransferase n=1 Tax=Streptomyces triticagri TaxID=2293568 RepID=A0A372M5L2_9ACTN|nr:GNAT family N-acetyltransferase [Streptomyces triticagri]RFU86171.1 GNAT family N-acetyltransferase [Streptomyces triticagri]